MAKLELFSESHQGTEEFYEAARYCKSHGLDGQLLMEHGDGLRSALLQILNEIFEPEQAEPARMLLEEYDLYLHAQDFTFDSVVLSRAECLMHLLPDITELRVISAEAFTLNNAGLGNAHLQLVCCVDHPLDLVPLPAESVVPAFEWLYAKRKLGTGLSGGINATDVATLATLTGTVGEVENAVVGLALATNVDAVIGAAVTTLLASNISPLVKALAAITYIRQADTEALSTMDDLDGVFESSAFRAFANATLSTGALFKLISDKLVGGSIAKYVAYLVQDNLIGSLQVDWVTAHFSELAQSIEGYGVSEDDLLSWVGAWDVYVEKNSQDVLKADTQLIKRALGSGSESLPQTRAGAINQLTNEERTRDEWIQIISVGATQHLTIVETIVQEGIPIPTITAVSEALINVLATIAGDTGTVVWGPAQYSMMDALLKVFDAQQKDVIGIRLRAMLFAESVEPANLIVPLGKYGHLIPDIQPSNPQEVQRIVLFLAYLSSNPESTKALAKFFDAKADQVAAFKYSTDLRNMMGEAVAKLAEITPALYKKFAQTKGFKRLFQTFKKATRNKAPEPGA